MPLSVLRGQRDPGERWTERDAALAVALTQFEAMLCPGCGHPLPESMDPDSEGQWVAALPSRCHACTAISHRAKEYTSDKTDAPDALRFGAAKRQRRTQPPPNTERVTWPI